RVSIGRIQTTRLARARICSRLARRSGLSGSLLPAETTLISAAGSTRGIAAPDGMPIFALTLQSEMYLPAPAAIPSPTMAQGGLLLAIAVNVASVVVVSSP